jgi:hypothetical protein
MNQTKHTPEPWVYGGMVKAEAAQAYEAFSPWIENAGPRTTTVGKSVCIVDADMKRLVACVNACAGMTDPEKEVAELRKQRDELHAACAATYVLMEWLDTQDDDTGFLPREIANWLVDMWPEMRAISGPMKYTHAVDRAFIKIGKSIGMKVGQFNETSIREALGTIDAIKNAGGGQ